MLDYILKFIYPDRCVICGEILEFGSKGCICGDCRKNNNPDSEERCKVCGRSLRDGFSRNGMCMGCAEGENYFTSGLAVFPFSKVRNSVHNLKYYGGRINVKPYAQIMFDYMQSGGKFDSSDFDIVTFVPMFPEKERRRGYNQARLIAEQFAEICGKPCEDLLAKTIYTTPQSRLSGDERKLNVKDTFAAMGADKIKGKRILIIDDVLTTGSTINECAKVLSENGAKDVMFITFAFSD
ncbi:MAG: ComF family protein [Firmicutes bacterium]|nr:ComF family protein [Bacillota bacterium]